LPIFVSRCGSESFALAPEVGFEPTTNRLTADRSTTELLRNYRESGRRICCTRLNRATGNFVEIVSIRCRRWLEHSDEEFPHQLLHLRDLEAIAMSPALHEVQLRFH